MESGFIGLPVSVKLKEPAVSLNGVVASVNGQRLFLADVLVLESGQQLKEYIVHGAQIADIEVLAPSSSTPASGEENACSNLSTTQEEKNYTLEPAGKSSNSLKPANQAFVDSSPQTTLHAPQTQQPFADPAILSFERSILSSNTLPESSNQALTEVRASILHAAEDRSSDWPTKSQSKAIFLSSIQSTDPQLSSSAIFQSNSTTSKTAHNTLNLQESQEVLDAFPGAVPGTGRIQHAYEEPASETHLNVGDTKRIAATRRKRGKSKKQREELSPNDFDTSPETKQKLPDIPPHGWRQTPMLQQQVQEIRKTASHGVQGNLEREMEPLRGIHSTQKSRKQRVSEQNTANGWATEDANDIHDMGDFDFEANLSKFDKLAVWDELRNGDTTADEDRLVSLNRVKHPMLGTFGGKKLLPSENVLDRPRRNKHNDEFGDNSDNDLDPRSSSRRKRRDPSRSSLMQPSSQKDSANAAPELSTPVLSGQRSLTTRSLSQAKHSDSHSGGNSRGREVASLTSSSILSSSASEHRYEPSLRYAANGKMCRTIPPETLLAVENLAHNGFGLSEDILAENAGRGIAEVVLLTINPKGNRLTQPNHNALPVVVALVGDNKAGGRALAAARHLMERNVRVVACLTGSLDLKRGPLSSQILRFHGKFLRTWLETSSYLKTLDAPPELIIDGLVDVQSRLEDLEPDQLAAAMDMMAWANRSKASVLAIDIPSGVDSSYGTVAIRDGEPVMVRSKIVVSCGAPCTGLLEAMASRQNDQGWRLFVVDTGVNPAARPFLKKLNATKQDSYHRGKYIHFGDGWVVGLRYDTGNTN